MNSEPVHRPSSRLWWLGGVILLAGIAAAVGWRYWPSKPETQPTSDRLVVVISGDTAGWIVPCGCTSNQSGGLLRRGTFVRDLRNGAEVLLADAGGAPGGTSEYHRVKFEAILRGEQTMNLAAHNLGGPELALGLERLRETGAKLGVPFVSANLRDAKGQPVAEPIRIVERAGRRIAFTGVLSRQFPGPDCQIDDPREALLNTITAHKGKYDALIVLAYLPEEELHQLAAALPEADAIIGGPTGQSIAPRKAGSTLIGAATNKGKFLICLETSLTERRAPWTGRVVEMDDKLADDPEQQANVQKYLDELARRDFPAAETGFASALPLSSRSQFKLAGSDSCLKCHAADCTLWKDSKHAHAWETLSKPGYHVDSYCQQCHTTGFGLPAGFESVKRSPHLRSVGCESCHGPSQAHMENPKLKTPFAAADQCVRCHDRENSPNFQYDAYWPRVRHGKAAEQRNGQSGVR